MVNDVRTLWLNILESRQNHGVLAGVHDDCEMCKIESDRCEKLKDCVQDLMDQGVF